MLHTRRPDVGCTWASIVVLNIALLGKFKLIKVMKCFSRCGCIMKSNIVFTTVSRILLNPLLLLYLQAYTIIVISVLFFFFFFIRTSKGYRINVFFFFFYTSVCSSLWIKRFLSSPKRKKERCCIIQKVRLMSKHVVRVTRVIYLVGFFFFLLKKRIKFYTRSADLRDAQVHEPGAFFLELILERQNNKCA